MDAHSFLIVDPNLRFLEKSEEILHDAGYRMIAAADGLEARDALRLYQPTGVLAFMDLDGFDGLSLCRYIKNESGGRIPVIMMCPEDPESIAVAEEAGADNVLFRPVKRTELLFSIRTLIRLQTLLAMSERSSEKEGELAEQDAAETQFEFFKAFLTVELKRARRYKTPLSLLLLSLDRIDEIEDKHGEAALQQVLLGLTRGIQRCVRDIDIPVTLQDDTMLVLMPHTDRNEAYALSNRVRERISRSVYHEGDLFVQPTISVGQTTYISAADRNFSQVMRRATQAMRDAARQGGDQVVVL